MTDKFGSPIKAGDKVFYDIDHNYCLHPAIITSIVTKSDDEEKTWFNLINYVDTPVSVVDKSWSVYTKSENFILESNFDQYFINILSEKFPHMRATQEKDTFILYPGTQISEDRLNGISNIIAYNLCKFSISTYNGELYITITKR